METKRKRAIFRCSSVFSREELFSGQLPSFLIEGDLIWPNGVGSDGSTCAAELRLVENKLKKVENCPFDQLGSVVQFQEETPIELELSFFNEENSRRSLYERISKQLNRSTKVSFDFSIWEFTDQVNVLAAVIYRAALIEEVQPFSQIQTSSRRT